MSNFISSILILNLSLSLSLIIGCSPNNEPPPQESKKNSVVNEKVQFELREVQDPHIYQIRVTWPKEYKDIVIFDRDRKLTEFPVTREFLYLIRDNSPYFLKVYNKTDQGFNLVGEFSGVAPRDYVFSGHNILEKNLYVQANRVFFVSGSKVQTNGYSLTIKTNHIIAEDAEIFSFPINQKAFRGESGRDGGQVKITAQQGQGSLKIFMRGENGGDGVDGEPYLTRAPNGADGTSGAHSCLRHLGMIVKCWCTRGPGAGHPGANGLDGRAGSNSGSGGHSGDVHIEVEKDLGFYVNVEQIAGIAGVPGRGGEGQLGGFGGNPGNPTSNECSPSYPGPHGQNGKRGPDGVAGANGQLGKRCIKIGQAVNDCAENALQK